MGKKLTKEDWKEYAVTAESVEDFLNRYYKSDRFRGRGEEYAAILLQSHTEDFRVYGYDIISGFDSVTGKTVAFIG